jgi:hypothetical protein
MISVKIDTVSVPVDMGTELVRDSTEGFDFGQIIIQNSTQRTPYRDYADVELIINSTTYDLCIQKDTVVRVSPNLYTHTIVLAELVIKLNEYIPADRKFDTIDGSKTTYKYHIETIINTLFFNKSSIIEVHSTTLSLLDVDADEKEYTGTLLQMLTDMFRSVNAIPTLDKTGEINHQLLSKVQDSEITITDIIGEVIENDIVDYGLSVHAKVKNGTYEADLITGGTYFPAKGQGVTPRSINPKYKDSEVEWHMDGGIRRMVNVRIMNLDSQTLGTITTGDLSTHIVSKDEWDNLTIERTHSTLYTGKYQNNTLYYNEGDFRIQNAGVRYYNSSYPISGVGQQTIDAVIEAYWYGTASGVTEYKNQSIKTMEIEFYYQPIRDSHTRQERHVIMDRVTTNAAKLNNQKDSTLELNRFGNSNKAMINRMGNYKYQATIRYYEKDTPTFLQLNAMTSDGYKITKIKYLVRHTSCDVTYSLTKNQVTLNPLTSVNAQVSPFTIGRKSILTNFLYSEYIEFSREQRTDTGAGTGNVRLKLLNAFSYSSSQDKPIYNCQFYSPDSDITSQYINMSVQKAPMGQSFNFNAQFLSPTIAGWQLTDDTSYLGKKLTPVRYTNEYGQVLSARTYWGNTPTIVADTHPVGVQDTNYMFTVGLEDIKLNPNERFGMTLCEHCVSDLENLLIGDYFLKNNSLVKELGGAQGITVYKYPTNPKYTIYDQYAKSGTTGTGTLTVDSSYMYFEVTVPAGNSWAVCKSTPPYNVYFAYNNEGTDLTRVYINLLKYRNRLNNLT